MLARSVATTYFAPMSEAAVLPNVHELAGACVTYVHRAVGIELDFTPETLPILDHYLLQVGKTEEGLTELIVASAGAYFGEVLVRTIGQMRWHLEENELDHWRIEVDHVFLFFNPLGMVREAVAQAEVPGCFAHLEVLPRDRPILDQSLSHMGDVREDDYYRLAVRYEVIEQVVLALEGASMSRKSEGEIFLPSVYDVTARALRGDDGASPIQH